MQFVVGAADISGSDVWLFSAGADNPDVVAAVRSAFSRQARSVHVVTRRPSGLAATEAAAAGGHFHTVPVAEPKDGYLETHSLIAPVAGKRVGSGKSFLDCVTPDG